MKKNIRKKLQKYFWSYKYKCKEWCYDCCTYIWLLEEEEKEMRAELLKKWIKIPPKWKGDEMCEYLDEKWKCSVYNSRPIICRAFSDLKHEINMFWETKLLPWCTHGRQDIKVIANSYFHRYLKEVSEKWHTNKATETFFDRIEKQKELFKN